MKRLRVDHVESEQLKIDRAQITASGHRNEEHCTLGEAFPQPS